MLRVVVLILSLSLAGCMDSQDSLQPPVAEKPAWEVGQWWSYVEHRDDGIEWFNQTVVGVEEKHGFQTYRVREEFTYTKDTDGRNQATAWYDVETLGGVAYDDGTPRRFDCPIHRMQPLEDSDWYSCTMHAQGYVVGTMTQRMVVGNWSTVEVPAGKLLAVELVIQGSDDGNVGEFARAWYSPEVESYVRLTEHGWYTRELAAWGT